MYGFTASTRYEGESITLRIEEWPEGFYVFFLRASDRTSFRDELQDTLEIAKSVGAEEYGIKEDAWTYEYWPRQLR